jgi:hypothetical protein
MNTSQLSITQLASTINAHTGKADHYADKAEQHYKAAGIHLMEAKQRIANGEYEGGFVAFLKNECRGLSSSRAYELIAIGNGSTTLAEQREVKAERMKKSRETLRHVVDSEPHKAAKKMSEGEMLIARGQAAFKRIPAGGRKIKDASKELGDALLIGWNKAPNEDAFRKWLALNAMADIPRDSIFNYMFYSENVEIIEDLQSGLDEPSIAGYAFLRAIESYEAAQVKSPVDEVILKISLIYQGKTLEQLQEILKAAEA